MEDHGIDWPYIRVQSLENSCQNGKAHVSSSKFLREEHVI